MFSSVAHAVVGVCAGPPGEWVAKLADFGLHATIDARERDEKIEHLCAPLSAHVVGSGPRRAGGPAEAILALAGTDAHMAERLQQHPDRLASHESGGKATQSSMTDWRGN